MMNSLLAPPAAAPRRPLKAPFVLIAVLGPLVLFGLALWFGVQARQTDSMRGMLRASYEKRITATELLRRLADAESAQRGFLITGNPMLVGVYDLSRVQIAVDLARLDKLYAAQPEQAARIVRLRALLGTRFRQMARLIHLRERKGNGATAATLDVVDIQDVGLMDEARATVLALTSAEESVLGDRLAYVHARYASVQRFVLLLMMLIGAILLLGLWTLWQARVHRHHMELRAHEAAARLRAIFASTTDAIMILDPRGMIEAVNAATTRMLGYAPSELANQDASQVLDMMDGSGNFHQRVGLVNGRLAHPNWLDRSIRHRDGHAVSVDIALGLMPLPGELHIVAAIRDISERKAAEQMKDDFVATVSHELRTPLTSVVGSLGLLRAGSVGELPDAAHRLVEIAENNSRRLIRLINDILDIEKIGSGQMNFENEPLDLARMVARAAQDGRGLAEAQHVRVAVTGVGRPLVVQGDEDRLLQVVSNLLSNAIRFSPRDGCVSVSVASENGQATVSVEDQGPGIPPEFHGRIFERFAQASDGALRGGTGLGLAISREIIAAHEGRIWFGRADCGGAKLSFSLPLLHPETEPSGGRLARILVCDPDAVVAESLRAILERDGCDVDCVGTAREGEEGARSGRYDGLILALTLPDADGLAMVRGLRARPETRGLRIILLSPPAWQETGDDSRAAAEAMGLVDWIDKPVDRQQLLRAVRGAIDHSAATRPTLLHIDDDGDMLEVTAVALADQGRVVHATSVAAAREMLTRQAPDLVILDLNLPDGTGLELLPELLRPDGTSIPTIIYSADDVIPEIRRQVDAVLVKSRRSLPSLARTIRQILASAPAEMETQ